MMPTKTNTNTGGTRMAYVRASRSQAICMKTATIKPAFKIMNRRMRDVSHPPVHDFEGRLDCRGLHAYGLGAAGPDVCHSGSASVGVGFCGHHGVRIELHAFHSDYIFWGGALGPAFI